MSSASIADRRCEEASGIRILEIDRVFTLPQSGGVYYPSYVEEEAIHAVDETIPVKAITAYVYEEFLQNLNKDFAKREGLLFVGGFAHPPNADAVLWFAKEVFRSSGNRSRSTSTSSVPK